MSFSSRSSVVALVGASFAFLSSCNCGTPRLRDLTCHDEGSIAGRVCAPDQRTWVNGATVKLETLDCQGMPVELTTTTAEDGSFSYEKVPPGTWTLKASLGAFTQDIRVTVDPNTAVQLPDDQLCVAQKETRIAVVTGAGDQIEDLLTSLKLDYTLYDGLAAAWDTDAEPFLANLDELKKYDLVFIDCAAAKFSGNTIDLGPRAAQIAQNLRDYVAQGGSVYGSDWALLFAVFAAPPSSITVPLNGSGRLSSPFDADLLLGYAPQTVTATIEDPALASFLHKSTLNITFPHEQGAWSRHWGLLGSTTGQVLVSTRSVRACPDTNCATPGPTRMNVPLAIRLKAGPAGARGGNVVYTSFHNIAQTGDDVAQVLKYLVLNL